MAVVEPPMIDEPQIEELIQEFKNVAHPSEDDNNDELIRIFLEDYNYDFNEAVQAFFQDVERTNHYRSEAFLPVRKLPVPKEDTPCEILRMIFPQFTISEAQIALEENNGNIQRAASTLADHIEENRQALLEIPQFPTIPTKSASKSRNKKKKKVSNEIGEQISGDHGNQNAKALHEFFPNVSIDRINAALANANNDVNDAAVILSNDDGINDDSPAEALSHIYPTLSRKDIVEALDRSGGDRDKAANILASELRSDDTSVFIENSEDIRNSEKGDTPEVPEAPIHKRMVRSEKPYPHYIPTRTISIDLHGKTCDEAADIVNDYLRSTNPEQIQAINFITGRGVHSPNGSSRLRPVVFRACRRMGFKAMIQPFNKGVVLCRIDTKSL